MKKEYTGPIRLADQIHVRRIKNANLYNVWIGDGTEANLQHWREVLDNLDFVTHVFASLSGLPIMIELDPRYKGDLTAALKVIIA